MITAEQLYGSSCEEVLRRWDEGDSVWSVELGGLGPGYEQAIQLTGFEILRVLLDLKPDAETWANEGDQGPWKALMEKVEERVNPITSKLGLSGAQWGAGVNLACVFYRNGPTKALEMVDRKRHIQVRKNFPCLD